jgi:hypothetical protein
MQYIVSEVIRRMRAEAERKIIAGAISRDLGLRDGEDALA